MSSCCPVSVVAGGIGGLSNILYYTFNIPVSIGSIALNAPLLIAALFKLKKSYSVRTVFACVVYSSVTLLFEKINFFQFSDSRIIGVVMGGALSAAAITVAYFAGGSNGGSEIVTGLVSVKNPHVEMGKVLLIFNLGVYALAFALQRELMQVLYSLLMSYVTSFCVKIFMNGIDPVLKYTVITKKSQELDAETVQGFQERRHEYRGSDRIRRAYRQKGCYRRHTVPTESGVQANFAQGGRGVFRILHFDKHGVEQARFQ